MLDEAEASPKQMVLKVPVDLHKSLKVMAARRGVTLVYMLHEALRPLYEIARAENSSNG